MTLMILLSIFLPVLLILANTLLNKKEGPKREKMSPFECGFDPKSSARLPFSIRFYMIAVIFLIFDIEITLIMPIPFIFTSMNPYPWASLAFLFLMILLIGLYHEWKQGALSWTK